MSVMGKQHRRLIDGKGYCSVPKWRDGLPDGFCNDPAYGFRPKSDGFVTAYGEVVRHDGRYSGYVPALACPGHGGPEAKDVGHIGDPCEYCGTSHDEVPVGPCFVRVEAMLEEKG